MEQDIIALQELYAHQSHELRCLSDELFTQQKQITQLQHKVNILINHIKKQQDSEQGLMRDASQEIPPPHY